MPRVASLLYLFDHFDTIQSCLTDRSIHRVMAPGRNASLIHLLISHYVHCLLATVSPGFDFVLSVLVKRLAGKSTSEMTYFGRVECKTLTQLTQYI